MGDIKKKRKKYSRPSHPWQKERIDKEKELLKEYGLVNKKEIWKADSMISNFSNRAKKLTALKTEQSNKESKQLLSKLISIGLLEENSKVGDVLILNTKNMLDRRLQSIVLKKNLAKTSNQARQFIVHGHISVGEKKIRSPSYLVLKKEEELVNFIENSNLASLDHPERVIEDKKK